VSVPVSKARPPADSYVGRRAGLTSRTGPPGPARRAELVSATDAWLAGLLGEEPDVALVAVGGLGRGELAPGSDLDLVLLHRSRRNDSAVANAAERLWYAVWDAGLRLDHSVRTVAQSREVAAGDLKAALGLLDARHVAGDPILTTELRSTLLADWRTAAPRRLPDLRASCEERSRSAGELAFLLEPDLKEARGGLRDVTALRAVAASWFADWPHEVVRTALPTLLDVRDALHRVTNRSTDRLLLQDQDAVAAVVECTDADALMRRVAESARAVSYAGEVTWRRVERELASRRKPSRRWLRTAPAPPIVEILDAGVVAHEGEVHIAADARPRRDPVLLIRAAAAAAQAGLPLSPYAVDRLAAEGVPLGSPWPLEARQALVRLLGAGHAAIPVVEALDRHRLFEWLIPDWGRLRSRPQRNALHRWTVDRHSLEAAAEAANLTRAVYRPDLLLVATLLHDIGKGWPGDHVATGAICAREAAARMGFPPEDVAVIELLVAQHLLLPETATRRDLEDPATVARIVEAVQDGAVLDLLYTLTEADARATGPTAWTPWRARLVSDLVRRSRKALAGSSPGPGAGHQDPLPPEIAALLEAGDPVATVERGDETRYRTWTVTVVRPDRAGLLATVAGVLAVNRLDVRAVRGYSDAGMAITRVEALPRAGDLAEPAVVLEALRRALDADEALDTADREGDPAPDGARAGRSALGDALARRDAAHPRQRGIAVPPPRVVVVPDASASATVLEIFAHDRPGLLHTVAKAIAGTGTSARTVIIDTLGAEAVDVFYLIDSEGAALAHEEAERVAHTVRVALAKD
jgi:[protein-PII] uridylyltransferase